MVDAVFLCSNYHSIEKPFAHHPAPVFCGFPRAFPQGYQQSGPLSPQAGTFQWRCFAGYFGVFHISKGSQKKFSTSFPAIYRRFSGQRANFHTVLPAPICSGRRTRLGRDVHFSTVFLWKSGISCGKAVIFLLLSPTFPPAFPARRERGCGARHGAQRKENTYGAAYRCRSCGVKREALRASFRAAHRQ